MSTVQENLHGTLQKLRKNPSVYGRLLNEASRSYADIILQKRYVIGMNNRKISRFEKLRDKIRCYIIKNVITVIEGRNVSYTNN